MDSMDRSSRSHQHMSNPTTSLLPPGFRFHPTDGELILHYLKNRAASTPCPASIIAEVDIYKFDPWDLPAKAMFGDKEWYFFSPRDRKYPNGVRPNRAAATGYWKATGTDKPIHAGNEKKIGVKKALVFYKGRPPKGLKTNWIMHEYRLAEPTAGNTNRYKPMKFRDHSMRLDDWVLCRIYKRSNNPSSPIPSLMDIQEQEDSYAVEDAPPYLPNDSFQNINQKLNMKLPISPSISELFKDYASLSQLYDTQPEFDSLLMADPNSSNQLFVDGNDFLEQNMASECQKTMEMQDIESSLVNNVGSQYGFLNQQLLTSQFGLMQ